MAFGIITEEDWLPGNCVIKIENKTTGSIYTITTEVYNFSEGGGGKTTESIAHFGDAFLKIKKPQEDFEVSFDVSTKDTFWFHLISNDITMVAGSASMVKSGGDQDDFKIKLEWTEPTTGSQAYKMIYYNATAVEVSKTSPADDRLTASISFKVPPTNSVGSGLKYEIDTVSRYDSGVGSSATGSYGAWEQAADTLLGYTAGGML